MLSFKKDFITRTSSHNIKFQTQSMNSIIENTLYHLTYQKNFDAVSEDQIAGIVNEYPFFATGQLLFSLKLKKEANYKSSSQIHKTALFFNNPEWYSYHLQNDESLAFEIPVFETVNNHEPVLISTVNEEFVADNKPYTPQHFQHIEIPSLESVKDIMSGNNNSVEVTEIVKPDVLTIAESALSQHITGNTINETQHLTDNLENRIDEYDAEFTDEQEENEVEKEDADALFPMSIPQSISNQLADAKAGLSKQFSNDDLNIKYNNEPYHAVDYFDSQGIKLDLSKLPQDRLTRQLLKFTDWLKHVKTNVSPNPKDLGTEPELETKVQTNAQQSNDTREIYTETMAEVYAKQGKLEKAIQIYIKLSFLNPNKTAFFAKKIQDLKGI